MRSSPVNDHAGSEMFITTRYVYVLLLAVIQVLFPPPVARCCSPSGRRQDADHKVCGGG